MSFFLNEKIDYTRHNEEVRRVWDAHWQRVPYRVPVSVTGSITNYMQNPVLNTNQWSFKDLFESPDIQIKAELEFQRWQRFHLVCDCEMGIPESGWQLPRVNFQNCFDAGWFGCPVRFFENQLPDTEPILADDKTKLYDMPEELPHSNGLMARGIEFFECMREKCGDMDYEGRPVLAPGMCPGEVTDGPLELALKVRGAENVMLDMLTDEQYYHDLLSYITKNLINRIKKQKELRWSLLPDSPDAGVLKRPLWFGDDAIAMISVEHYREFVLPYHKRFVEELGDGTGFTMHLCGDSTRHFKFLVENLGVTCFDTGFPVDHGKLREQLGPEVGINGGPTIMTVKYGTPEDIEAETKAICQSGVMRPGRFVLIAANCLAPCTPVENVRALYEAGKKWGRYPS